MPIGHDAMSGRAGAAEMFDQIARQEEYLIAHCFNTLPTTANFYLQTRLSWGRKNCKEVDVGVWMIDCVAHAGRIGGHPKNGSADPIH